MNCSGPGAPVGEIFAIAGDDEIVEICFGCCAHRQQRLQAPPAAPREAGESIMARLRTHGGADGAVSGLIYLAVRADGAPRAAVPCEQCGWVLPASDKCAGCGLDHRYSAKTQDAIDEAQNEYAALAGQTLWSDGIRPRDDESEYSWEETCGPPGPEPVARVLVC